MSRVWQIQEAKQRFSEVVRRALAEGPQTVTRRGQQVVVVVAADRYRELAGDKADFKALLLSGPDLELLEIRRSDERAPAVDL